MLFTDDEFNEAVDRLGIVDSLELIELVHGGDLTNLCKIVDKAI
jgi:hypothetical protein